MVIFHKEFFFSKDPMVLSKDGLPVVCGGYDYLRKAAVTECYIYDNEHKEWDVFDKIPDVHARTDGAVLEYKLNSWENKTHFAILGRLLVKD